MYWTATTNKGSFEADTLKALANEIIEFYGQEPETQCPDFDELYFTNNQDANCEVNKKQVVWFGDYCDHEIKRVQGEVGQNIKLDYQERYVA